MSQNKKQVEKSALQISLESLTVEEVRKEYGQAVMTGKSASILSIYQKVLAKGERKSERGYNRIASRLCDSIGLKDLAEKETVTVTIARDGKETVTVTVTYKAKKEEKK